MSAARFVLSLLGVALFLAMATVLILAAVLQSSGTPMLDWGTRVGGIIGALLLAVLILRAILLWAENRKQHR